MKKTLLIFLLVLIVLAAAGNYLITSRVETQLAQAKAQLAPIGTLNYGTIRIDPRGELHVNQLAFYPHASNDVARVERFSVVTDSLLTLFQLATSLDQGEPPQSMRLEMKGVQMDFRGDWLSNLTDAPATSSNRHLYAAGCGERTYFSFADLDQMGYMNPSTNLSLEYQLSQNDVRLLVFGDLVSEGMYQLHFNVDLLLHDDVSDPMMAMMGTQLRRVEFSYTNLGFTNSVISFCARETGLTQEAFIDQHLLAWQALWAQAHIELGEDVMVAYREFIEQPERLTLESYAGATLMQFAMAGSADATLDILAPQIKVNGGPPRQLALAFVPPPAPQREVPESAAESAAQPEAPAPGRSTAPGRILGLAELDQFQERSVTVRLEDGRRYQGVIAFVENERLHLRRTVFNGQMVMPVRFDTIAEVRLSNQ